VTGTLHFQVHPCGAQELLVDPLPETASRQAALYPDGAHIKDLKEVRDLLYKMQRPAIAPSVRVLLLPLSPLLMTLFSWCTRTTGRKRISSCSIIVACCTLSLVPSSRTRCARSISAISLRRMIRSDLRRRT
jgi:hypothetical protein